MNFTLEFEGEEGEEDGRWTAEILELPSVLVYGVSRLEAKSNVEALALRVLEGSASLEQA
jgi:predicted RNase H-like HicB family nuclease